MQCRVGEGRVERFAELKLGCIHQPRVEPFGPSCADHAEAVIDPDDVGAHFLDLERQRPVAAADIEDVLSGLRVEQVERRLTQRRHKAANAGVISRIPLRSRGGCVGQTETCEDLPLILSRG